MVSFSFLSNVDATTIVFIVLLVVLIAALLIVPMFTNKKRAKQTEELHRSLQPGDLIKTVGGIIGTIKEIRQVSPVDREMVIETGEGDNKTTMVFDIQALYQVMSRSTTVVAANGNNDDVAPEAVEGEPTAPKIDAAQSAKTEDKPEEKVEEKAVAVDSESEVKKEVKTEVPEQEQAAVAEPVKNEEPKTQKPKSAAPSQKKPIGGAKKSSGAKKTTSK